MPHNWKGSNCCCAKLLCWERKIKLYLAHTESTSMSKINTSASLHSCFHLHSHTFFLFFNHENKMCAEMTGNCLHWADNLYSCGMSADRIASHCISSKPRCHGRSTVWPSETERMNRKCFTLRITNHINTRNLFTRYIFILEIQTIQWAKVSTILQIRS